jgi:hypothetical protein
MPLLYCNCSRTAVRSSWEGRSAFANSDYRLPLPLLLLYVVIMWVSAECREGGGGGVVCVCGQRPGERFPKMACGICNL